MKLAWIVALAFLALICKFETAQCNLQFYSSRAVFQERWLSRAASQFWDFYLPTRVDPNSTCGLALQQMAVSLADKRSIWAARMVDSWGKSDDGIMYGRFFYEGSYDECMSVASSEQDIRGKYCRITIRKEKLASGTRSPKLLPPWFVHRPEVRIIPGAVEGLEDEQYFRYSTCIPSICSHQDLWESLNVTYSEFNSTTVNLSCKEIDSSAALNAGDYAYIIVMSTLFAVIIVAGLLDIVLQKYTDHQPGKVYLKYLIPFSFYANIKKLFQMNTNRTPEVITCLNGMRVLSMVWVIYGHQQTNTFFYTANILEIGTLVSKLPYQIISNAYPSVDTFFFMSGILVAYNILKEVKKNRVFNPILFYVHRLIRLLPPILVVSGLFGTVTRFFETGPFFSYWDDYVYPTCRDYFWKDILMLNNFNLEDLVGSCLGQCWYVSVDTQLYLVAPLFILPLVYKEKLGKFLLYFVTLMSVMVPALIIYVNDLPPSNVMVGEKGEEYFEKVYLKPWSRAGPWVIGIWLGYIFHKQGKERFVLKQWQVVAGWSLSTTAALLVQFGMYSYNIIPAKAMYEIVTQVTYGGFQRSVWAACLAWVVFACHNGYGGFVDGILSHPVWQPLSRLTYSLYLVALPMQSAITFTARTHFVFSYISKIFETAGALFISGVVAVLVSLSAESPVLGLEKLLLKRTARRVDRTVAKTTDELLPEDQIDTMGKKDSSDIEMDIEGNDNKSFATEVNDTNL